MNPWIRRGIVAAFALGVLTGGVSTLWSWAHPKTAWCQVSQDTVKRISAESLPTNLKEFTEIPKKYRRAVLSALPAEEVALIMGESVQSALQSGHFNGQQQEMLSRALSHITVQRIAIAMKPH